LLNIVLLTSKQNQWIFLCVSHLHIDRNIIVFIF
jgi:hypothetical protein